LPLAILISLKTRGVAPGYINLAPLGLSTRGVAGLKTRGDAPGCINLAPLGLFPGAMPLGANTLFLHGII